MIDQEQRDLLDACFRIARESSIDGLAAMLRDHPNRDAPSSELATRKRAEGAIVGIHGLFVRNITVPRFAEDMGRYLFGITDGADDTLIDLLVYLEGSVRAAIPVDLRDVCDSEIARLFMLVTVGWVQRRERLNVEEDTPAKPEMSPSRQDMAGVLQAAIEQSPIGIYVTDYQTAEPVVNNTAHQQMFGYSMDEELVLEPERFQDQHSADDDFDLFADLIEDRVPYLERISSRPHKDGHPVPFHVLAWPVRDEGGAVTHLFSLVSPATRSEVTSGSGLAEKRARYLSRLSPDPVVIVNASGHIRYASPSVASVLGYDPSALIGTQVESLFAPRSRDAGHELMGAVGNTPMMRLVSELELALQDGTSRWFELMATNLLAIDDVQGIVLQGRDVTERRNLQERLEQMAHQDVLTGLLNRRGFLERFEAWLGARDTTRMHEGTVACYIDLDRFKGINDTYGHPAGDAVLVAVGQRLAALVDGRGFAGRIGGDEFVLLVEFDDRHGRDRFERELTLALHGTVPFGEQVIAFAGSAGIFALPQDGQEPANALGILRDADEHLTTIKAGRRKLADDYARPS